MKILSGAYTKDAGDIRINGRAVEIRSPRDALALGIRVIYQELNLVPHLSVAENIFLGAAPVRWGGFVDWHELYGRTSRLLADLGMSLDPRALVSRLGIAQRQMVEIAKALSGSTFAKASVDKSTFAKGSADKAAIAGQSASVLVMDEPTSSLTSREVTQLFALIQRLAARGVAIVYITHRLDEVFRIGHRITVMRDGRVVATRPIQEVTIPELVRMMANRDLADHFPKVRADRGDELLRVENVGGAQLSGITFSLHAGEVLGIAGLLGAGRTHLLRTIFGLEPVTVGRIRVAAFAGPASPRDRWRHGVGMLSEDRAGEGLAQGLSVADNLTLSHLGPLGPRGFVLPSRQRSVAARWADRLAIRCADVRQPVAELSGGNQQKVAFARLLHHDVDVLILDEPTKGIDVASKAQIYELIDELARARKAVLLVSSYFPELLGVCDRIAVMSRGRLGPPRSVEEWNEHSLLMEASGARAS
jgi:ribose transport system ATP-binding protein